VSDPKVVLGIGPKKRWKGERPASCDTEMPVKMKKNVRVGLRANVPRQKMREKRTRNKLNIGRPTKSEESEIGDSK